MMYSCKDAGINIIENKATGPKESKNLWTDRNRTNKKISVFFIYDKYLLFIVIDNSIITGTL